MPRHFEHPVELVGEDDVAKSVPCGPDPEQHLEAVRKFLEPGDDHVWVHQVGPDQDGFFTRFEREVMPKLH